MQKLKLLLKTILPLCMAICLGCESSNNPVEEPEQIPSELSKQQWKLTKVVKNGTDQALPKKELEGKNTFVITFKDTETFSGYTAVNDIQGTFAADSVTYKISLKIERMTEVNETELGHKYIDALEKVKSYTISNQELKLIYDDTTYLLYKSSTP